MSITRPLGLRRAICVLVFFFGALSPAWATEFSENWKQGALIRGKTEPGSTIEFAGREVKVSPAGDFILGLGRDAAPEVSLKVTLPAGTTQEYQFDVKQRDYQIQRIEGVKQKHVTPPKEVLGRIRREARLVAKARETRGDNLDFLTSFQWPLEGPITGVYGSQRFYNGEPRSPHYGVDFAVKKGTPVHAPSGGVVTLVHDDMFYSGGTLIIDHGYGLSSTFIHLNEILVEEGQRVAQGDVIAKVGASGRATGPHLDWRMNWFGERIDPQLLMSDWD